MSILTNKITQKEFALATGETIQSSEYIPATKEENAYIIHTTDLHNRYSFTYQRLTLFRAIHKEPLITSITPIKDKEITAIKPYLNGIH